MAARVQPVLYGDSIDVGISECFVHSNVAATAAIEVLCQCLRSLSLLNNVVVIMLLSQQCLTECYTRKHLLRN
ncbi:hypothetical protein DOY81_001414 [Sarcophaga bullata]|nr:hypothetical protein DOY81_001414 [Sarcophaga bullata]